jgi:Ni,Fe-hydrogenase I small subunit
MAVLNFTVCISWAITMLACLQPAALDERIFRNYPAVVPQRHAVGSSRLLVQDWEFKHTWQVCWHTVHECMPCTNPFASAASVEALAKL